MAWEKLKTSEPHDLRSWLIPLEEALPDLPEVIGDKRLVQKVRLGQGMLVRDLSSQFLSDFDQGRWIKITSPGEGLVAILKSEVKHSDIPWANLDSVVFRPLRVFHPRH